MIFSIDDIIDFSNEYYRPQYLNDVECIKHLHYSAEIVIVTSGELTVIYNDKEVNLSSGQGVFISPFQTHGFVTKKHSETAIFTFSLDLIEEFASFLMDKDVEKSVFCLCEEEIVFYKNFDYSDNSLFNAKAILYPLCKKIYHKCEFKSSRLKESSVFFEIIKYIIRNFKEDISLESTAKYFGLNYKYLSRMFKTHSGMGFSDYLNGLRCTYAMSVITNPMYYNKNISEIAFNAGFGSIRNFNRIFKRNYGITPREVK